MMTLIPRVVAFDENDKALCAGNAVYAETNTKYTKIMHLPTDHYDFLGPLNVKGKTAEEIETEAKEVSERR